MKYRDPRQLRIDWTVRLTDAAKPNSQKPPDKVILSTAETTNPFIFNDCEICLNPEVVEIYKSGKDIATVLLAQAPNGEWCYGYQFDCYNGGSSSGAGYGKYRKTYLTRHDALMTAVARGKEWSGKYKGMSDTREAKFYEKLNKAVDKFIGSLTQLT